MREQSYVVLSDMHFGMEESNVNKHKLLDGLAIYLEKVSPLKAVIFSGDLLDLNLSTFVRSIEGSKSQGIVGFREFLQILLSKSELKVSEWVYIPGNHDYRIWDILAVKKNRLDVLANGRNLRTVYTPLYRGVWDKGEAFIAGVFPVEWKNKVTVAYPDYIIESQDVKIVVTHGHYLDPEQTLFNRLAKLIKKKGYNEEKAVREMFIETAIYQTVAGCTSFTPWTRKWINNLVGPGSWSSRISGLFTKWFKFGKKDFLVSSLRDEPINKGQLIAMEFYLKYFGKHDTAPGYVVYGHTHCQGHATTEKIQSKHRQYDEVIQVYNAGSFYDRGETLATFLYIDLSDDGKPIFTPCYIAEDFTVRKKATKEGNSE